MWICLALGPKFILSHGEREWAVVTNYKVRILVESRRRAFTVYYFFLRLRMEQLFKTFSFTSLFVNSNILGPITDFFSSFAFSHFKVLTFETLLSSLKVGVSVSNFDIWERTNVFRPRKLKLRWPDLKQIKLIFSFSGREKQSISNVGIEQFFLLFCLWLTCF